jgi:Putative auto-transporter adhesin, head GIN domain
MNTTFRFLSIILLSVLVITACSDTYLNPMLVDGNGDVKNQVRTIETNFTAIELQSSFEVILSTDITDNVVVEAESNLLPYIQTIVSGNKLFISSSDATRLNPQHKIKIYAPSAGIANINVTGSGSVSADSLNSETMYLYVSGSGSISAPVYAVALTTDVSGSGEIEIRGRCRQSDFTNSGSGNIKAFLLSHDESNCELSSSGNIFISAWNKLNAVVTGSGSVYYKGTPSVSANITGSGKIIPG